MNLSARASWYPLCIILAYCSLAVAQSYPTKPIRIIVPLAPGGGGDVITRVIGQKISEGLKQAVVVENRAGAATIIGTEIVARSPADGYTLLMATSSHGINPSLRKLPFRPIEDFSGVSLIAVQPLMLAVHPSVPAKTVNELIKLAKTRPGQLNFASNGNASVGHLSSELLNLMAGIKLVHIGYKGSGPALNDLLAGQVDVMFTTPVTTIPFVRQGKLRALAMSSLKRSPAMPELPTMAEAALPGFESEAWYAILAPAGIPAAVATTLSGEIAKAVQTRDVKDRLGGQGVDLIGSTPQEALRRVQTEVTRWSKVIRQAKIKAD